MKGLYTWGAGWAERRGGGGFYKALARGTGRAGQWPHGPEELRRPFEILIHADDSYHEGPIFVLGAKSHL